MDMSGVSYVTENITLGIGKNSSRHQRVAQKRTSEACTSTGERRKSPSPPRLENIIENEIFYQANINQMKYWCPKKYKGKSCILNKITSAPFTADV